ncbi:hypothetical protein [Leptolyngbya ohadii]|uniref:hypothetical protein n=1 Tax=Leptolyngbya ohadii TaxID=1962290 RepID=UPI000B5992FC|nr:hypothetical protein [Leptolyngbya ohadii]
MRYPQTLTGFTVYQAANADTVTILPGFEDVFGWRIICSCRSYAQALEMAKNAAQTRQLPLILPEQDITS